LVSKAVGESLPALLSPVRRRHEFELILKETNPLPALTLLDEWDALRFLHPEARLSAGHRKRLADDGGLSGEELVVKRLADWFIEWGPVKAKSLLDELQFERKTKQAILEKLTV
jgi:tRNA nucleotidyltransferase/poly(A) polymerase